MIRVMIPVLMIATHAMIQVMIPVLMIRVSSIGGDRGEASPPNSLASPPYEFDLN